MVHWSTCVGIAVIIIVFIVMLALMINQKAYNPKLNENFEEKLNKLSCASCGS